VGKPVSEMIQANDQGPKRLRHIAERSDQMGRLHAASARIVKQLRMAAVGSEDYLKLFFHQEMPFEDHQF